MATTVRSFAKINLGLAIGARRPDGFHGLETIYQTVAAHDLIRVVCGATGHAPITIRCDHPAVPCDATNTCYRVAERMLQLWQLDTTVEITIDKRLPVQGGMGAGSANAVATLFALERELGRELAPAEQLRIAAEVGSDLPLFLLGGTVLGAGRGEQVYPLPDLPTLPCVLATPSVAVSTPQAFQDWDALAASADSVAASGLTSAAPLGTLSKFSRSAFSWLSHLEATGVPAGRSGDRAETLLLDLVRAGIENDFERVVFPQYPELHEVKRELQRAGAKLALLSGSGSSLFGLFDEQARAGQAVEQISATGVRAIASTTLTRRAYQEQRFV